MVLIIIWRLTSFSCYPWCINKIYFSPNVTVCIVTSVRVNAGRFLSFVYILQTTWMSNENPVENPNGGRKKTYDVDVVVITIIAIKREEQCRISGFFCCAGDCLVCIYVFTCGPHFARCPSHEVKQFLGLKHLRVNCCRGSVSLCSTTSPLTQHGWSHFHTYRDEVRAAAKCSNVMSLYLFKHELMLSRHNSLLLVGLKCRLWSGDGAVCISWLWPELHKLTRSCSADGRLNRASWLVVNA